MLVVEKQRNNYKHISKQKQLGKLQGRKMGKVIRIVIVIVTILVIILSVNEKSFVINHTLMQITLFFLLIIPL